MNLLNNAIFKIPMPFNEPVKEYAPGSAERAQLKAALAEIAGKKIEIPLIIGGKEVRTGNLGQVVMPHDHQHVLAEYHQAGELCISEQRDFIYLPARDGGPDAPYEGTEQAVPAAAWCRDMDTDSTLLFRFSALTFNGHRIHYDQAYASAVEGYPALVVHGPMTAILLADLARENATHKPRHFRFRALAPLFCGDQLRLRGSPEERVEGCQLIAYGPDGQVAMNAEVLA